MHLFRLLSILPTGILSPAASRSKRSKCVSLGRRFSLNKSPKSRLAAATYIILQNRKKSRGDLACSFECRIDASIFYAPHGKIKSKLSRMLFAVRLSFLFVPVDFSLHFWYNSVQSIRTCVHVYGPKDQADSTGEDPIKPPFRGLCTLPHWINPNLKPIGKSSDFLFLSIRSRQRKLILERRNFSRCGAS